MPAEGYLVAALSDDSPYRLGYDSEGRTALLAPPERADWPPLRLANLSFLPMVRTTVTPTSGSTAVEAVAVVLIDARGTRFESLLPALLAGVIAAAGPAPALGDVGRAVRGLRDIFQALTRDASSSYVGVWGELFLMNSSTDPMLLSQAWGSDPAQTFDFAIEGERLEVKTTVQAARRHHFSLSQLLASANCSVAIASLQTAPTPDGATARELLEELLLRLVGQPSLAARVLQRAGSALGEQLLSADAPRYDRQLAADSLLLFAFDEVPGVTLAPGVVDVQWVAQLPAAPQARVDSKLADAIATLPGTEVGV